MKAPQSWRPELREKWGGLPPEIHAEVLRRESEIQKALQEAAEPRKFHQSWQQTVAPFEALMRAEAAATGRTYDPMQTVGNLLQTAVALRTAPPATKGALVANIIKSYGVPEEAIVAALQGQTAPAQQQPQYQPQQQFRDPRLDQLLQQAQHAQEQRHHNDIETFAAKHEFLDDVKEDMADLLEVAERRGRTLSLADAYARAVAMNPEVSKVLEQRKAAQDAGNANASIQRAKAAGSSVKTQPAGVAPTEKPNGIRGHLEAAYALHANR